MKKRNFKEWVSAFTAFVFMFQQISPAFAMDPEDYGPQKSKRRGGYQAKKDRYDQQRIEHHLIVAQDEAEGGHEDLSTCHLVALDNILNEQENPPSSESTSKMSSPSYFSSLQNNSSNTFDWMRESALSGCDRFGRWIASYAKDIPPVYFAKSLLEVDYAHDALFWQGHFKQEIDDIRQAPFLGHQGLAQLKDLQNILWNGLLSPYVYESELKKLEKKSLFSRVWDTRNAFQSELKENPEVVVQFLRRDLINSLEAIQNNGEKSHKTLLTEFKKKLVYYRRVMNAFDYAETLAGLFLGMEQNKEKLSLSDAQYKGLMDSLNDALHKINKEQYLQIEAKRESKQSVQEIGALKKLGKASSENDGLSYYMNPYKQWKIDEEEKFIEEKSSLWKTVFIGWLGLALTGDMFTNLLSTPMGKSLENKPGENQQPVFTRLFTKKEQRGLSVFEEYGNSVTNIISNFAPYAIASPLFMSLLSSTGGRGSSSQLFSVFGVGIFSSLLSNQVKASSNDSVAIPTEIRNTQAAFVLDMNMDPRERAICDNPSLKNGTIDFEMGTTDFENGKLVQTISKTETTKQEGQCHVKIIREYTMSCDKDNRHAGWRHIDEKLHSYERFWVFAVRGNEERNLTKRITANDPTDYTFRGYGFETSGSLTLDSQGCIPEKYKGKIITMYERPDNTSYHVKGKEIELPLIRRHKEFIHYPKEEDYLPEKHSYQVIKLFLDVHNNNRLVEVDTDYHLKCKLYPHQNKHIRWVDHKTNHTSDKIEQFYIDPRKAEDYRQIPENHKIVIKEQKTDTVPHESSWFLWYKIPYSGDTYL